MKLLKFLIIALIIVVIALFTGTWLFDAIAWVFNGIGWCFSQLSGIFNFFGWNAGII